MPWRPKPRFIWSRPPADSTNDLDYAVRVAATLTGVKEISMSWGGGESSWEAMFYDPLFTAPGIVYLASSGDTSSQMEYPAASPDVVSCGGTSVSIGSDERLVSQRNGLERQLHRLRTQRLRAASRLSVNGVASVVGTKRGVSDLSFDANPNTGVYVYDSTPLWGEAGWWILGGTSVASPSLAGVINLAATSGNGFAANTAAEQSRLYGNLGNARVFRDVTSGTDGKFSCKVG